MADLSATSVLLLGDDDLITRGWTEGLAEARARIVVGVPRLPDEESRVDWCERVRSLGGELEFVARAATAAGAGLSDWLTATGGVSKQPPTIWLFAAAVPAAAVDAVDAVALAVDGAWLPPDCERLLALGLDPAGLAAARRPRRIGVIVQPLGAPPIPPDQGLAATVRATLASRVGSAAGRPIAFGLVSCPVEPRLDELLRRCDDAGVVVDSQMARLVSPRLPGRALAALCKDPDLGEKSGRLLTLAEVIAEYRLRDIDGVVPDLAAPEP